MWLREIVFTGVFGVDRPAKISIEKDFCSLSLPPGASANAFRVIILSLMYPDTVSEVALRTLGDHGGDGLRFGLVIESGGVTYKLLRQVSAESVTLQRIADGQSETVAKGARAVRAELDQVLVLPDMEDFLTLYCWDFGSAAREFEGEEARLLDLYCRALQADSLELERDRVQGDLDEATRELTKLRRPLDDKAKIQQELDELKRVTDLTEQDRAAVAKVKAVESRYEESLSGLEDELALLRDNRDQMGAKPLHKELLVVGPVAFAVLIFLISAVTGFRAIALLNLLVLGVAASTMLRRLGQSENVALVDIQAQQVQKRMSTASQVYQEAEAEAAKVLEKAGVSSADDLAADLKRVKELRLQLGGDLDEDDLAALQERIDVAQARVTELEAEADRIRSELEQVGEVDLPAYEVEYAATESGLDLADFKLNAALKLAKRETISQAEASFALLQIAQRRGLYVGTLSTKTAEMWNKLVALVLGRGWDEFDLEPDGSLSPPSRTLVDPNWEASHPVEVTTAIRALAAALVMSTPPNHEEARFRFMCIAEPFAQLDPARAQQMGRVLKSLAGRANVLLLLAPS